MPLRAESIVNVSIMRLKKAASTAVFSSVLSGVRAALNDHAKKNAKRKEHHYVEQLVPEEARPRTTRIVISKWNPLGRRKIRDSSCVEPEVKRKQRAKQEETGVGDQ